MSQILISQQCWLLHGIPLPIFLLLSCSCLSCYLITTQLVHCFPKLLFILCLKNSELSKETGMVWHSPGPWPRFWFEGSQGAFQLLTFISGTLQSQEWKGPSQLGSGSVAQDSSLQVIKGAGIYFDSGCGCTNLDFWLNGWRPRMGLWIKGILFWDSRSGGSWAQASDLWRPSPVARVCVPEPGWAAGAQEHSFSRSCGTFYPPMVLELPEDFCHGFWCCRELGRGRVCPCSFNHRGLPPRGVYVGGLYCLGLG